MTYPKISVIVPCYNVEKYVDRTLRSVFDQTYPVQHMEVLCVNDASTDGTIEKLKDWESRYPDNMIVIDCEENGHLGKARNIGLCYASGEWIAFIDSDDWIEKDYLLKLYEAVTDRNTQLVGCQFERDASNELVYFWDTRDASQESSKKITGYSIQTVDQRKSFFRTQPLKLYAWGKLIRRDFLVDNGIFFPEHVAYEDIVWGNLVNMYVENAVLIDRQMYHYYVNPGSIVLKRNEAYHIDHITTQEIMWEQLTGRDFGADYSDEFEYEYLYNGYLAMLKILALRYDEPSYSVFRLLQALTSAKISRETCISLQQDPAVPELHRLLFGMIHVYVSKDRFAELMEILKRSGI